MVVTPCDICVYGNGTFVQIVKATNVAVKVADEAIACAARS